MWYQKLLVAGAAEEILKKDVILSTFNTQDAFLSPFSGAMPLPETQEQRGMCVIVFGRVELYLFS